MSRIGKKPNRDPQGVQVTLAGSTVALKGPKGSAALDYCGHVAISQVETHLEVARHSDERQDRAYHGLYQRLLASMMKGVTEGFSKDLQLVGVGYRAAMEGKTLVMTLGYSHEVRFDPPEGITLATPAQDRIVVQRQRQATGRPGCRQYPLTARPRTLQGQGHPLRGRAHPAQGRQDSRVIVISRRDDDGIDQERGT